MAPNARPGGSSKAPAGQAATGQVTAEVKIDPDSVTGASQAQDSNITVPVVVHAPDEAPGWDDHSGGGTYGQEDRYRADADTGPVTAWHDASVATAPDADNSAAGGTDGDTSSGWEADSTAAWNPASAWAEEDAGTPDNASELWDDVPDWEGEIVVWEGQGNDVVPAPAGSSGWAGAPTYPPAYLPAHLPSSLVSRDDAVTPYLGQRSLPAPPGVYDRKGAPRTKRDGPWRELVIVTAVAVIVSAVILAVTTAEKSNLAGIDNLFGSTETTVKAASPPSGLAKSTAGAASPAAGTSATTAPRATSSTLSQHATSLPVTAGVAESLVNSWLASNPGGYGITAADVAGTVPNEVHYAVQRSTGTYWALAAFKPTATLSDQSATPTGRAELAEFQNSVYAFSWQAGPVWTLLGEFSAGSCPDVWVPRAVLAAWGLCGL